MSYRLPIVTLWDWINRGTGMTPRAYRLSKAMRMLAEVRIGRVISVEIAQEIHDSLVRERSKLAQSMGVASDFPLGVCLSHGWIEDEMGPQSGGLTTRQDSANADDEHEIGRRQVPIHVSIRAARLLAMGSRPPTLLLMAAVREIQSHLMDDPELSEEFKRMHTDIMCDRRHEQWRDAV